MCNECAYEIDVHDVVRLEL